MFIQMSTISIFIRNVVIIWRHIFHWIETIGVRIARAFPATLKPIHPIRVINIRLKPMVHILILFIRIRF
jgi:hypothetical protein